MIHSFRCEDTKAIHDGYGSRKFRGIEEQARKRLRWLYAATSLAAIRGNHLEALKRDRAGQHGIRINDQWRIGFSWRDGNAYEVELPIITEGGRDMPQRRKLPPSTRANCYGTN